MEDPGKGQGSIRTRLTLMVTGILVTAVVAVGSLALLGQYRQLHQALGTKAGTLVQFMSQVTPLGILSLNFVELNNHVKKVVLTDDEAVYAIILNGEGIPLAYFFKDTDPAVNAAVRALAQERKPLAAVQAMKHAGDITEVIAPITAGERSIGSAILGFSTAKMRRVLLMQAAVIGVILLLIIALSIALLRVMLRRILEPVQTLTAAAERMSSGDLSVVTTGTERTDELGVLSKTFESMAGRLRELIAGLERQLRFVETLLQTIPMAIFYKDTEGRYLGCNDEFTKVTGVTKEEIVGKTVFELWPGELSQTYHRQDLELLENPAIQVYDFKMASYRGELLDVVYYKNVFLDEKGRVAGIVGAFLDITERKRAEEERRASDARYRRIVDLAVEGICSLGPDAMIAFVNARMAEMLGYAGQEMIGRPLTDFMFEEDAPDHLLKLENRRHGVSESYERRFRRKNGQTVWTLASAAPIFDETHHFQGSFAMFSDITERKLAEEELRHLKDELEERVKERTAEIGKKNQELERMIRLFAGRELRMAELKEQIGKLKVKQDA